MLEWSPQQEAGLKSTSAWARAAAKSRGSCAQKLYRVFGYAGSGKSTLVKHITDDIPDVLYCAFTGKAASVLRQKGCANAMTIHQALYKVSQKGTSRLEELKRDLEKEMTGDNDPSAVRELRNLITQEEADLNRLSFHVNPDAPARSARLIVIDECSMVGAKIGRDLTSLGVPILVMGDPAQLPPVKDVAFFMDDHPDVLLTEVHRQARDSGILQLATLIRQRQRYTHGMYGEDCEIVRHRQEGNTEKALSADQMLVGIHTSRRSANYTIRKAKGREGNTPLLGDKLVCLKNNHELGIMNGSMWEVVEAGRKRGNVHVDVTISSLEQSMVLTLDIDARPFRGDKIPRSDYNAAEHFDFGEAITCHKAQGSQWDFVYGLDESHVFDWRHLYTMVTRAARRLVLMVPNT